MFGNNFELLFITILLSKNTHCTLPSRCSSIDGTVLWFFKCHDPIVNFERVWLIDRLLRRHLVPWVDLLCWFVYLWFRFFWIVCGCGLLLWRSTLALVWTYKWWVLLCGSCCTHINFSIVFKDLDSLLVIDILVTFTVHITVPHMSLLIALISLTHWIGWR